MPKHGKRTKSKIPKAASRVLYLTLSSLSGCILQFSFISGWEVVVEVAGFGHAFWCLRLSRSANGSGEHRQLGSARKVFDVGVSENRDPNIVQASLLYFHSRPPGPAFKPCYYRVLHNYQYSTP